MSGSAIVEAVLLSGAVFACWVGVVGMVRMRTPTEALHFLSFPTCVSSVLLAAAVFVRTGNSVTAWKTVLIAVMLFAVNAVVTHATARAFRAREIGHWQPCPEDGIEMARKETAR